MKRIFASVALALALTGVVAATGAHADDTSTCEGTPPTYGHEWQGQSRSRDLVPEVVEVSHQVYSYKKQVELTRTEHEYKKEVRTTRTHKSGHPKDQLVHDWQWWFPASIKWRDENFAESGLHGQWDDHPWKYTRVYRYTATGDTRQVPDGHTWEYSGEVTEPRDAPWQLLPDYPRTEVTTEHVPAYYTPWTDWADAGDVARTDEHTEPETPADTDVIEHRWVYVGTYVKVEATDPKWQDADPDAPCFNGPEQPEDDYFKDQGEYMTCEGLFSWVELFGIPYVWDGDAWVPGEPVSLEHLEDKVRDLTLQERFEQGCVPDRPEEPRNPDPTPDPTPEPTPTDPPTEEPTPDPTPTPEPKPTPTPETDEPTEELAETGVSSGWVALLAAGLVVGGAVLVRFSTRRLT